VRWTAPEVFSVHKFYKQSDVWSFGVVCWECWSDGAVPFADLDNQKVINNILKRGMLEKPEHCPQNIYDSVMKKCFIYDFKSRPSFAELSEIILKLEKPESKDTESKGTESNDKKLYDGMPDKESKTNDLELKVEEKKSDD